MKPLYQTLCENGIFESNIFNHIRIMKCDLEISCHMMNDFTFVIDSLRDNVYKITRTIAYEKIKQSTP